MYAGERGAARSTSYAVGLLAYSRGPDPYGEYPYMSVEVGGEKSVGRVKSGVLGSNGSSVRNDREEE